MNQIKTLAALAVAAFALLSNLFALIGYTPPVALDHLLHLTPEQIASGAAVVLAFLAPLHSLAGDAVTMVREFLARGAVAEAENAKLRADLSDLAREFAKLKTAQAQQSTAPAAPPAQAGRSLLSHLLIVLAVSMAGAGVLWLSACSTLTAASSTQQSVMTSCTAYTSLLQALTPLRAQHQLSDAQVAAVNQAVAVAGPICTGPLPADPAAALMSLSSAVAGLQAVAAPAPSPAAAASAASR